MKLIPIHELSPGMKLAEDIYGKFDLLYASRGDVLTEKLIDGLSRLGTQSVYVDEGAPPASPPAEQSPQNTAPKAADTPLKDYQQTITLVYELYAGYRLLNRSVFPRIEKTATQLLEFVLSDPDVLRVLSKLNMIDGYTLSHSIQVSVLSILIAQWLELSQKDQFALGYAGLLHDVGKTKVPVQILNKPSRLTDEEYEAVKKHAQYGFELIKGLPKVNEDIRAGILQHHEKSDGSGYPQRLPSDSIHFYAQILCISDIYAAMTADRVYNRKLTPLKAADEVFSASCSGKVNPEVANLLLKNLYHMLVGSKVRLNNGKLGEIVYFNRFSPGKPLVRVGEDFIDLYREKDVVIEEII